MMKVKAKVLIYHLGTGYHTSREGKPLYSWPYNVDYAPGYERGEWYMSEGDVRNGNGEFFSAYQVLQIQWRGHLDTAGVLWLVPLLERMASGEAVSQREVLEAYQQVHGKPPDSEIMNLYS